MQMQACAFACSKMFECKNRPCVSVSKFCLKANYSAKPCFGQSYQRVAEREALRLGVMMIVLALGHPSVLPSPPTPTKLIARPTSVTETNRHKYKSMKRKEIKEIVPTYTNKSKHKERKR